MRILLLLSFSIFITATLRAQSYKSSLTFQKNLYSVATIQVPFEEDAVTAAIKDYMSRKGYKDAHYKDFILFRSVPLDSSSSVVSDAYFNISQKSHSEKDLTLINLLPVKKGETLLPVNAGDSSLVNSSIAYLNSMRRDILSYTTQQQILAEQKTLDKINAKLISLKNDSGDIAKKIRNYESDLQQNKIDQDKQTKVISNTATGDQDGLAKAHKKMDKLMDSQTDYEKKIRNYKADLEENTKDRETQKALLDKETQSMAALKQRHQDLKY
jgi:hypothetical protein